MNWEETKAFRKYAKARCRGVYVSGPHAGKSVVSVAAELREMEKLISGIKLRGKHERKRRGKSGQVPPKEQRKAEAKKAGEETGNSEF